MVFVVVMCLTFLALFIMLMKYISFFMAIFWQLKSLNMRFTKFWPAFIGDAWYVWSITPSDNFPKQNKATHFAVHFKPNCSGVSEGNIVIETEVRLVIHFTWDHFFNCADGLPCINSSQQNFKTWKVVGSTGDCEFWSRNEQNKSC